MKFINYLVSITFAFLQVFRQILAQVHRICPFVRRVHVVGVLMRLQPDYYGPNGELNQKLYDRAQHHYFYNGPVPK